MDLLTIGEVAARSGLAASALRYYEEQGLIAATRTPGGARRYPRGVLRRLAFVRAARNVGLSLPEIRAALATLPDGAAADHHRLGAAVQRLAGPARRADRGAGAAARRADLLHRLRLPVAGPVRAVEPGRRRGAGGRRRAVAAPGPAPVPPALTRVSPPAVAGVMIEPHRQGEVRDDRHAGRVLRTRQPDERAREEPLHRGLARVRPVGAPAPRDPRRLRALVRARHRRDRDAAAAHHPRLLRLPAASSSTSTTSRPGLPELYEEIADIVHPTWVGADLDSWGIDHGTWSVLMHAFPDADIPVVQLSINALKPFDYHLQLGRRARAAARGRRPGDRQRQRRAQPRRGQPGAARRRVRLGAALRRGGQGADADRPDRGRPARRAPRLRPRRPDARTTSCRCSTSPASRGRPAPRWTCWSTATPTARCR